MPTETIRPTDARIAFDRDSLVWLCLTTLHHRRFIEDAVHVAGLPRGAQVRLRYRRRYVDAVLWSRVRGGCQPDSVQVLVALAGSSKDGARHELQPLRSGRVVMVRCEGDVMVLDVCLGDFVYEGGGIPCFANELSRLAPALPRTFLYDPGSPNIYLQPLSFPPGSLLASSSVEAWERVADGFFRVDAVGTSTSEGPHPVVPFLYFIHQPSRKLARRLEKTGMLDIEASRTVSLEVHTVVASAEGVFRDPLGEIVLDVSHSAASFVTSRHVRIDSRRDVRQVRFATSSLFRRAAGHLSVRTVIFAKPDEATASEGKRADDMSAAKNREEIVVARYDFPLKIGRWLPWLASGFVALAAAVAAFKFPDSGDIPLRTYVQASAALVIAFVGVMLGLRGDSKR
jgi:hypothetical protein